MTVDYKTWYANNKEKLSQRRKQRYQTDPVYRQRQIDNARNVRQNRTKPQLPGVAASEVCELLEITPWLLNNWTNRQWLPAGSRYGRTLRYSEQQVGLIKLLADFMKTHGPRMNPVQRDEHAKLVQSIAHNWQNTAE